MASYLLDRFVKAQNNQYSTALAEIKSGRKRSHWMWFIFPQYDGLGFSEVSRFYAIKSVDEARAYLDHPILGSRLIEISSALLLIRDKDARNIFGTPDDLKLKSSMTLFASIAEEHSIFEKVLDAYFQGKKDEKTLNLLKV